MSKKTKLRSNLFTDCFSSDLTVRYKFPIFEKIAFFFSMIMLCIFPLLISDVRYTAITKFKFDAFRVITYCFIGVCLACLLGYLSINFQKARQSDSKFRVTFPQIFIFAFAIWNCLSALTSNYTEGIWLGQSRYEGLCSALLYCGIFLLVSFWGQFSDKYVVGMSVMAIPLGFIAVLQIFGKAIFYPDGYNYWSSGFLTTIGNIDCVSGIVSVTIPVLFCGFVLMKKKIRYLCLPGLALLFFVQLYSDVDSGKIALIAAAIIAIPFLFETKERISRTFTAASVLLLTWALEVFLNIQSGGSVSITTGKFFWLLLAGGVVLLAVSVFLNKIRFRFSLSPKKARIIAFIVVLALIVAAIAFVFFYSGSNGLIKEASELLHFRLDDSAGSGRGYIWKSCLKLIKDYPIFGGGPGTFYEAFQPYNDGFNFIGQEYTEADVSNLLTSGGYVDVDFAHNDYLQIGVCVGLVGLLLYLGFAVSLFIRAYRKAGKSPEVVLLLSAYVACLAYFFFAFSIAIVSPPFWVIAGLLDHCVRQIPKEEKQVVKN